MKKYLLATLLFLSACGPAGKSSTSSTSDPSTSSTNPTGGGGTTGGGTTGQPPGQLPPLSTDPAKLVSPWTLNNSLIVMDAYEGNLMDWSKIVTDKKVAGVIHRATIGLTEDSAYKSRHVQAQSAGLLWGAYHLGRSTDPIAQAKFFLSVTQNDPNTLMALDLEDTTGQDPSMMTAAQAVQFLTYVYQQTHRLPIIYANHSSTLQLTSAMKGNAIFEQTHLWYARFITNITSTFPKGLWPTYFLWQFASELNCATKSTCPYSVPGTDYGMDLNVFVGTKDELAARWIQ